MEKVSPKAELTKEFMCLVQEAFLLAEEIRSSRGSGYNNGIAIYEYFPHGVQDIIYEVSKKLKRVDSCMLAEKQGTPTDGPITDSILDSINYLSFAYAFHKMNQEGKI